MEWEKRSLLYGASLKSVLFKGMPDIINKHIHNWHKTFVLKNIETQSNMRVLDVGCGYGRLSLPIIEKYPKAEIIGIDTTDNFVKLYQEMTKHKAMIGTLENIPNDIGQFDYALCITVLMYVAKEDVLKSLENLIRHLKPAGKLILVEPQTSIKSFLRLFGFVDLIEKILFKERINTGGRYFKKNEIDYYVKACNCSIEKKCGLPFTTLFILPLSLIGKFFPSFVTNYLLNISSWFDNKLGRLKLPSIYYAYVIKNKSVS